MEGLFKNEKSHMYVSENGNIHEVKSFTVMPLDGDTVIYKDGVVTEIVKRSGILIPGVLLISSRVNHGLTKNGQLKEVIPMSSKYPHFIANTTKKYQAENIYVVIKFHSWEPKMKMPRGEIVHIVGDVGDYDAELEYLKWCHEIRWKPYKNFDPTPYTKDLTPARLDLTHLNIVSIDPEGCVDIDDALSIRNLDDGCIEIGIHIADPSSYISEGSELDQEIRKRGQSVYLSSQDESLTRIDMLPEIFSTNICSLKQHEKRRAFSCILIFDKNYNVIDIKFVKTFIKVGTNMSYEYAENVVGKDETITKLYEFARRFNDAPDFDTHKMIEFYMVLANKYAAEKLVRENKTNALLRRHGGTGLVIPEMDLSEMNSSEMDIPKDVVHLAMVRKLERAEYVLYSANESTRHNALNLEYYTHFTSPIRRYADIIVHRLLSGTMSDLSDLSDISMIPNHLNKMQKQISVAEREYAILNAVYTVFENHDSNLETEGYVVSINDNKLSVYIPEFAIEGECKLFANKIKHSINYESTDNFIRVDPDLQINLFDRVKIQIIISIKSGSIKKKLLIKLVEPEFF